MSFRDDIIEFEFTFHKKIIFSFTSKISSINYWKGINGVFNDRVDIWLMILIGMLLMLLRNLRFRFIYFSLREIS